MSKILRTATAAACLRIGRMWMVKQLSGVDGTRCEQLWNASTSYSSLAYYTGQGWARDGWLTNSHWNPMIDFMFHGRKEADKIPYKVENI
ncbi:hypothetical protein TELCIR_21371, partial [Teladorsagia circumcincta]